MKSFHTDRSETSGTTGGKWNRIFRSNRANQEEWLLPFFIPFPNSLHKGNLLKRSRAMNWFVKMERQISVRPVGPVKVDYLQSGPEYSVKWNRNGPFHLTSDRYFPNFWHNVRTPNLFLHYDSSCYANTSR